MGFFAEFKKFVARGNVLDLAVGVIIGAAFGKITTSLTESILMPLIGWIFGDVDFSRYFVRLGSIPADYKGDPTSFAQLKEAGVAMIGYGDFLTQVLNFLIIAFALFLLVRSVNRLMEEIERKQKETDDTTKAQDVPADPQLDVLKQILAELKKSETPAG
jgi:large conductance mechanosensitive channel